jgi:hypothetical protein
MLIFAVQLAIFSYVFTEIFMDEDMVLWKYHKLIMKLPYWLYKPLGGCLYCFAGQIGLWGYFLKLKEYDFCNHMLFISLVVFISFVIDLLCSQKG